MPRRSLADARRLLEEDLAPSLSDYWLKQHRESLNAAEKRAQERAQSFVERREAEVLKLRDQALHDLTDARDQLQELASEGQLGRIGTQEYARRLGLLRAQQTGAEERLGRAQEAIERIAEIEQDPIGWADQTSSRFPHLREELPW